MAQYRHEYRRVLIVIEGVYSMDGDTPELPRFVEEYGLDALAVGLSFAFLKVNIALASPVIGVVAFAVTAVGFISGKKASKLIGKRAEAIGAIILLVIAFRILLSHIL